MTLARLGRAMIGGGIVLGALAAGTWIGGRGGAAAPPPGSTGDPLVTRSYVTQALGTAFASNGGRIRTLAAGETFAFAPGTVCALVAGTAAISVATVAAPAPPMPASALVDLTAGRGLGAQGNAPTDHLLVATRSGAALTAGPQGAVLWLSGPQATAAASGAP